LQCRFWMLFKQQFLEFLLLDHLHKVSHFLSEVESTDINILIFKKEQL
jgi:hypothetical protein